MDVPGGLQRSMMTFRRSGSSGLVWEDRLLSESSNMMIISSDNNKEVELRHSQSVGMIGQMTRSRSHGSGAAQPYRADRRVSPVVDPPSPKISGCGFFGIFRNSSAAKRSKLRRR
ncbi:hypothetical protein Taro_029060 [Colocasia esculenta]|uniref:Uncharacterized protein n=1 Tax=Colocasia esculenta TaxID=4460 RepID=A0A843VIW7_COLES|nr:hypothetical protein [Colocasia esculenta]